MNRLNYFAGYQRNPDHHEDQLTRAFLVVLRLVPVAQAMFFDMIRERFIGDPEFPSFTDPGSRSELHTQVGSLVHDSGYLVSLVLTDEDPGIVTNVVRSDRRARYDGLVVCESGWQFVIENKPHHGNLRAEQFNPALPVGTDVMVVKKPVVLEWKAIIERLGDLVARGMLEGAGKQLVEDFFAFVDDSFMFLNPFHYLGMCKNSKHLLWRRCVAVMADVGGENALSDHAALHLGHDCAKTVYLQAEPDGESWRLVLSVYPGDTVSQARHYYKAVDRSKVAELRAGGWVVRPNLHFSFMATNIHWSEREADIGAYLEYWSSNFGRIKQHSCSDEGEFERLFSSMLNEEMISDDDLPLLRAGFSRTKRSTINICPGVAMMYRWPREQAIALDRNGDLQAELRRKIAAAVETWGGHYQ